MFAPMSHFLTILLLALGGLTAFADDILTVKIGDTNVQLCCPVGMVDMPKDDPIVKALVDLVPPNCQLLRSCISSEALDTTKAPDPSQDIITSQTFAMTDALMDIDSGDFIDFVDRVSIKASHGDISSEMSGFDYVEVQKQLDQFQKDSGVGIRDDGDLYSLGMVSRSDACVSYMEAQYQTLTYQGQKERDKIVSVVGYLRLNKKVLIAVTSIRKPYISQADLRTLKHAAEKYQLALQFLNNL
jgi:hypothetical protein